MDLIPGAEFHWEFSHTPMFTLAETCVACFTRLPIFCCWVTLNLSFEILCKYPSAAAYWNVLFNSIKEGLGMRIYTQWAVSSWGFGSVNWISHNLCLQPQKTSNFSHIRNCSRSVFGLVSVKPFKASRMSYSMVSS